MASMRARTELGRIMLPFGSLQASLQGHTEAKQRESAATQKVAVWQAALEAACSCLEGAQQTVHRERAEHEEAMTHQGFCSQLVRWLHSPPSVHLSDLRPLASGFCLTWRSALASTMQLLWPNLSYVTSERSNALDL